MKNKLIIGRYLPLDSWVHHLDPRAKLHLFSCSLYSSSSLIRLQHLVGLFY